MAVFLLANATAVTFVNIIYNYFFMFYYTVHFSALNTERREPIAELLIVCIQESHTHTLQLPDTNLLI